MNLIKKILVKKNVIPLLIVVVFALLAARTLFKPGTYFIMHDDLQMMRQLELEKCFKDFQIPCRWTPDMGYGFGFPLFNYYPPLPYLIGEIFRLFSFSFVMTAKLTFALAFVGSGITMYFFAKEFFGRTGGVLASIFYVWAPYHAVDIYVRGAMNESWALVWFPLIFLSAYRLIKDEKIFKWITILALSWAALFMSHNIMVLIFAPFFAVWILLLLIRGKKWGRLPQLVISGIAAFFLSAFFLIPVFIERKYVHINTLISGYYEYWAHFVSVNQLFISRFWGDGPSTFGTNDGLSFQIGFAHWILPLAAILVLLYSLLKRRKKYSLKVDNIIFATMFLFILGGLSIFMTHTKSFYVWQLFPILSFVQFPWRFLTLAIFGLSFTVGFIPYFIEKTYKKSGKRASLIFILLSVTAVLILNWNYFKPVRSGPLTDEQKFSGEAWRLQQQAGILDYLPATAKEPPDSQQKTVAEVVAGEAKILDVTEGTNWAKVSVDAQNDSSLRINILKFPVWTAKIDGKNAIIYIPGDENWGRMYVNVPQGVHEISLKLEDTPVRTFGNIISLFSWVALIGILLWRRRLLR